MFKDIMDLMSESDVLNIPLMKNKYNILGSLSNDDDAIGWTNKEITVGIPDGTPNSRG